MRIPRHLALTPRKFTWLLAEALLPVALLFLVYWPIGDWANPGQLYAKERYLGSGDLIAVAVALIVPVLIHLGAKVASGELSGWPAYVMVAFLATLLVGGMIFYGAVKIKHVAYVFPDQGELDGAIVEMTNFCVWYLAVTLAALYAAKTDLQ